MKICPRLLAFAGVGSFLLAGCGGNGEKPVAIDGPPPAIEHETPHADEGPHGGHIIELGKEEYHAELVHDEKINSVTIYVLDSAAKNPVAIEAADITINLKHSGKGEQFKLVASPQDSDPPGKSSRFVSTDAELAAELDAPAKDSQLVLHIEGRQFRGKVEHAAEHGHDHNWHKH